MGIVCSDEKITKDLEDVARAFEFSGDVSVDVVATEREIVCVAKDDEDVQSVRENLPSLCDPATQKRLKKRYAKLSLYLLLERRFGSLPWGALTGVRPLKLAWEEERGGRDFKELFLRLRVSKEKISLSEKVLRTQKDADRSYGQDVFVSVPFCPTKCDYCSFVTYPLSVTERYVDDYVSALCDEIRSFDEFENVKSVYVGGGSPFVLSCENLKKIFSCLREKIPAGAEFTVEAGRPDTFSEEKMELCDDFAVTRVCVNPQTFRDDTLFRIGRKHTVLETYEALDMAKRFKFDVNLDLIAGLEGESGKDLLNSVNAAADTGCENVTVHALCLKAGSKLKERTKVLEKSDLAKAMDRSYAVLERAGYSPYYLYRQKYQAEALENTGWARPGKICRYNIGTMEEVGCNVAFGAGAITKRLYRDGDRIERLAAPKDIPTYIKKEKDIASKKSALFSSERGSNEKEGEIS